MNKICTTIFLVCLSCFFSASQMSAQEFVNANSVSNAPTTNAMAIRYSPDGKTVAIGYSSGVINVYNNSPFEWKFSIKAHTQSIYSLEFHPTGRYIATTSKDGTLKVWDLETKKDIKTIQTEAGQKFSFAKFHASGAVMMYGGTSGKLQVTHLFGNATQNQSETLYKAEAGIISADLTLTGNFAVIAADSHIDIVQFSTKKRIKRWKACPTSPIADLKYSPDESQIACLCANGTLTLWDAKTYKSLTSWKVTSQGPSTEVAFSPDGKYLATGDTKGVPKIWNLKTNQMTPLEGHEKAIRTIHFAPNSINLMSGGNTRTMGWKWKPIFINEQLPPPPAVQPIVAETSSVTTKTSIEIEEQKKEEIIVKEPTLEELKLTYTTRNIPDSLGDRRVRAGKRVVVASEDIEIAVWDKEVVDGDTISIFLNGEWLLKEYALKKKKKKLKIKINKNADNYFILYAHNEGSRPPNTAALTIYDGIRHSQMALSSDMKKCDAVNFKFK
ncbi:MAG: WD40 repeat domain-containing protein [Chitinophagales bacterium]